MTEVDTSGGGSHWLKNIPLWGILGALVVTTLAFGRVQSSLNNFTGELTSIRQDVSAIRAMSNASDREVAVIRADKLHLERELQRLHDRYELLDVRVRRLETYREAGTMR